MLYVIFFFFKQKTAYEMRISDWSSDVCSSDLAGCRRLLAGDRAAQGGGAVHRADRLPRHQEGRPESRADRAIRPVAVPHAVPGRRTRRSGYSALGRGQPAPAGDRSLVAADRKSVVSGTSVSVRVDIGGRRLI